MTKKYLPAACALILGLYLVVLPGIIAASSCCGGNSESKLDVSFSFNCTQSGDEIESMSLTVKDSEGVSAGLEVTDESGKSISWTGAKTDATHGIVKVPIGGSVNATVSGKPGVSHAITASLTAGCPYNKSDSHYGQASLDLPKTPSGNDPGEGDPQNGDGDSGSDNGNGQPGNGNGQSGSSESSGGVKLDMSLGKTGTGLEVGDLWLRLTALAVQSYSPDVLQYSPQSGTGVVAVRTGGAGSAIDYILTSHLFTKVVPIDTFGFEVRFYRVTATFNVNNAGSWGTPFIVWRMENPDRDANISTHYKISKIRGNITDVSLYTWTHISGVPGGTWELTKNGRTETKTVTVDPVTNRHTKTTNVRDGTGTLISCHFEKLNGRQILETGNGVGADMTKTINRYDAAGTFLGSEHQVNGITGTFEKADPAGSTTFRPFKDSPATFAELNAGNSVQTFSATWGSGEILNGYNGMDGIYLNRTTTTDWIETVDVPSQKVAGLTLTLPVAGTTTSRESKSGQWLTSRSKRFKDDNLPANAPYSGRTYWEQEEDGVTTRSYTYELGVWDGTAKTFTPAVSGQALRAAVLEGAPDPVANHSLKRVSITSAAGYTVCEETYVCTTDGTFNGAPRLTQTVHSHDADGHVTLSVKDLRTVYQAAWQNGRRTSETDEAGIVTTYPIEFYDGAGRATKVIREGLTVGDLPAIPAQITDYVFDAEGRTTKQTVTGGSTPVVQEWAYDTAGRLKTERLNGATTTYAYTLGGRRTTKIRPGGASEVTETYRDGRVKSVTGTGVVAQYFDYGVKTDAPQTGMQWEEVVRGSGAATVSRKTTRDLVGRTVAAERPGDGLAMVSTMEYDIVGHLWKQTPSGLNVRTFTHALDQTASTQAAGNGDGTRTETSVESYAQMGGEWYRVRATNRGTAKEKVGGFAANEISKTISTDLRGLETVAVTTIVPATKQVMQTTTRPGIGNPAVSVSRLGLTQSVTTFSGGVPAIYGYDGLGRQVSAKDPRTGTVTTTTYDPIFGNVATVATGVLLTVNEYYGLNEATPGRLKMRTVNGLRTYYAFDKIGRQSRVWGPAAYPLWYEYDAAGRLQRLHTYRTGDDATWAASAWPASAGPGDVTTWEYVPGTELLRQKLDAAGKGASYTYWPSGLLQTRTWARTNAVTTARTVTSYGYTGAGELKTTAYDDGTPPVALSYNDEGLPVGMTDAAGAHTLDYEAAGREFKGDTVAAGSGVLGGVGLAVGHDAYGRMDSLQLSSGGTALPGTGQSYTYEPATGRLATAGDGTNTATYTYKDDSDWLWKTVISRTGLPNALTQTREPDGLNRLQSIITRRGAALIEAHTWRYDAKGRRERDTLGDGSYWAYSYNERSEVTGGVKHLPAAQAEAAVNGYAYGYGYDPIGNRKQTTVNGRRAGYAANALNQYTSREVPGAVDVLGSAAAEAVVRVTLSGAPAQTQTARRQGTLFSATLPVANGSAAQYAGITIDALRSVDAGGAVTETASSQGGKVFVPKSPEEFACDLDGNTLRDGRWDYTWDGENRLIAVETRAEAVAAGVAKTKIEYAYDGRGRRIARTLRPWNGSAYAAGETRRFLYDAGWNVLAEINAAGAVVRRCLWGLDLSGSMDGAGGIGGLLVESLPDPNYNSALTDCLPFYDGNGNITGLIQANTGAEVARYTFGPFGETLRMNGPLASANPFRWSTKWTEELTGWEDYGYRWLGDGRWINRDPIEERGGLNLYGMVRNNSVSNYDLLGLKLPAELKCCKLKKITVNFTTAQDAPNHEPKGIYNHKTGRRFTGEMAVTCVDKNTKSWSVQTGGMRVVETSGKSSVNAGDDSAAPAGNFSVDTAPSGGTKGYLINTNGTGRDLIKIHYASYEGSHGCITSRNQKEWDIFVELMKLNKATYKLNSTKIRVQYSGVAPHGNGGVPNLVPIPIPVKPR